VGAVAVTALALACDSNDPTGPDVSGRGQLFPQFYTSGGTEGNTNIGVPANNASPDYGSVANMELVTASKYDFVHFEVTGTITSSDAGYCSPPVGPFGTWDAFGGPGGEERIEFSTNPDIGGLPKGGQGTGTLTIDRGISQSEVTFFARRTGVTNGCGAGPGLALSGSQTVSWEVYPYFDVGASPGAVTAGDSVTFTSSSHWTTTNNFWRFRENDTTSTPGTGAASPISLCTGQTSTCTYAPSKSGRMWRVGTFPDQNPHEMPGPIVWVGNPPPISLQLSSSVQAGDTATRGGSIDFSVSNTGAGGELNATDLAWRFEPDSVQFYPNGVSPKFAPPVVYDTVDADSTWSGLIVHPGKIIVSGVSGSNTDEDTLVVPVLPRSWSPMSMDLQTDTPYYNSDPPPQPTALDTTWDGGRFHTLTAYSDATFNGSQTTPAVSGGPNDGYYYVELSQAYVMHRSYSLNPWIENPGPAYWGGYTTWQYVDSLGDPAQFHNNTIAHEVGGTTGSHRGRQVVAASADAACGDVVKALERLVTGSTDDMVDHIPDIQDRARQAIWYLSSHVYVNGFQGSPNPVADWVNKPAIIDGLTDVTTDTIQAPDSSHCDVSGV
jgi:hypothetical protein